MLVKAFASGVILATGYMHVLPDSFDDLRSECLPENPWRKFPFTTFVAMLAAIFTLMVDSFSISFFKKKISKNAVEASNAQINEAKELEQLGIGNGHGNVKIGEGQEQLLKYRVVAQVIYMNILPYTVHSLVYV